MDNDYHSVSIKSLKSYVAGGNCSLFINLKILAPISLKDVTWFFFPCLYFCSHVLGILRGTPTELKTYEVSFEYCWLEPTMLIQAGQMDMAKQNHNVGILCIAVTPFWGHRLGACAV